MRTLKLVPVNTAIGFIRHRVIAMTMSTILVAVSLGIFLANGLNFGIDFRGGTLIEASSDSAVDLADLRGRLGALDLGDLQIQEFGKETDVLIRIAEKTGAVDASNNLTAVERVRDERREEGGRVAGPEARREAALALCSLLRCQHHLLKLWVDGVYERGMRHVSHDAGDGAAKEAEHAVGLYRAAQQHIVRHARARVDLPDPFEPLDGLLGKRRRKAGDGARN